MNTGARIQAFEQSNRVLAIAQIVSLRSSDGWCAPQQVRDLFLELRIPAPADLGAELRRLRKRELLIHEPKRRPSWSLTPRGQEHANRLLPGLLAADLDTHAPPGHPPAGVGGSTHAVLPPPLAPKDLADPIARMLNGHPFERNIFCMTRLPDEMGKPEDPVGAVIETLRVAAAAHDLVVHVADDRALDPMLFNSVAAYIWSCANGVAIFEDRVERGVNANMQLEAGAMAVLGRPLLLLRDIHLDPTRMPTDFTGHIRKSVDLDDIAAVATAVHRWLAKDLGFGECPSCPP